MRTITKQISAFSNPILFLLGLLTTFAFPASHSLAGQAASPEPTATIGKGPSGLPLPRFVSLKADRVNVRKGPSTDHGVNWIYRRIGLPVEIIQEFDHWRQIRDSEGSEGWVFYRLLSARRTALIAPWGVDKAGQTKSNPISILNDPTSSAATVVKVEAGVLVNILRCDGSWCEISLNKFRGWIEQEKLWGVYRGEELK